MKSSEEKNAEIGLEEESPILQAWRNLKNSIFNVLFVLLDKNDDEEQQSFYRIAFESGLDYLQMLAFPFDASVIAVWNGGETLDNVSDLISRLNISTYLPGVSFETFLVLLYALILLIILVLVDIIYVSYSFSRKKFRFTWPLVILAQLVPLFVTIFFLPITQTLISVVRCQTNEAEGNQYMISFPDIMCWQGWHLFHAAVTLLFSSLFVFISSVVALALFQPRMTTKKLAARQNSTGQVVFIMNKIICQLVFSFTPFKDDWVYALMLFLLSGWLYWTYNMNDPFYNKKVSKFFRLMSSYYFWTNFMLLMSQVLKATGFNGGLVIWLSGLPFIGIIIIFERKSNIDKLFSSNLKFKSGEELDGHLTYVLQLLETKDVDKNSYMLLIGYIQKHKEICLEDDCPLRMVLSNKKGNDQTSMDITDSCKMLIKQIERMYQTGIKKYPMCTKLCLSLAFFRLEQTKNKTKAYEDFTYALNTNPSFEEEFIVYRFKKIIKENLQGNSQDSGSDLIELIRFQNHISLCEEAMILAARLHKQFWLQLKEESPELSKLNDLGFKITQTVKKVKQNYQEIVKINNLVPEMLYSYAIFLCLVLKENIEGGKLIKESSSLLTQNLGQGDKKQKGNVFDGNDKGEHAQVQISAKREDAGKILNFNLAFTQISGFTKENLLDREVIKFMPDIFQICHKEMIERFLRNGKNNSEYIDQVNHGFIKTKSGFIVATDYRVVFNPQEEVFMAFFKLDSQKSMNYHFIVDNEGIVREVSPLASIFFNLTKETIKSEDVYIHTLFPDQTLEAMLTEEIKTIESQLDGKQINFEAETKHIKVMVELEIERNEQSENQEDHLLPTEKIQHKKIGSVIELKLRNQKQRTGLISFKESQENFEENIDSIQEALDHLDQIRNCYREPEFVDMVFGLREKKDSTIEAKHQFQLTFKIKTMRLLNNQIKMVYQQQNQADYNQGDDGSTQDDDLKALNMDDENQQTKIRKAINTKLDHQEVTNLRCCLLLFLLGIILLSALQMIFSNDTFQQFKRKGQKVYFQSKQSNQLSIFVSYTFDQSIDHQALEAISSHENELNESKIITMKLKSGELDRKNVTDSVAYMYSLLMDHFEDNSTQTQNVIYENYVKYLYPALNMIEEEQHSYYVILYVTYGLSVVFGLAVLVVWVLIRLWADKKKSSILLWFLDIPIPYVSYLSDHCDKYLKNFMDNKELIQKGINFDNTDQFLEEYEEDSNNNEEQMEEQEKTRKILIIKQRKQSIFAKLSCEYLKIIWILLFSVFYPILTWSYLSSIRGDSDFILQQWRISSKQINYFNYLHFSLYMLHNGITSIDTISLQEFKTNIQSKFLNKITSDEEALAFRSMALEKESVQALAPIITEFNKIYFHDICQILDSINVTDCSSIAKSSFEGGFSIVTNYLYEARVEDYAEVRRANENYGAPALLRMMKIWMETINGLISQAISICSILFYVYIVISILGFLFGFLVYLSRFNTELNEAIKMLNMIPFKLLSRSRKETRKFLVWIIRQANKKNHDDQ